MVANTSKSNIAGEWLLDRRWLWVVLASLLVLTFQFWLDQPLLQGFDRRFWLEGFVYAAVLPASAGLALSLLSSSRRELSWWAGCYHLQQRLQTRLNGAQSHDELAEILVQFFRFALPLESVALLVYDPRACCFNPVRIWPLRDKPDAASSSFSDGYFFPFLLNGSPVGAARFIFPPGTLPSLQQVRLLGDLAPAIASAFHRIQLEELVKRRAEIFDAEQHRIARDVHDTLGHSLVHLRLMLDHILLDFNRAEKKALRCEVESLREVVKDAYGQMRDVLVALTPDDDSDLVARLQDFAGKIRPRSGYQLRIRSFGKPRLLPPYLHRHIFFIFREALTNIEKHARARQVDVELCWQETCLEITITDDGDGFDTGMAIYDDHIGHDHFGHDHFGLKNIRQRALETGAGLEISSQPGRGTRILLSVPYVAA